MTTLKCRMPKCKSTLEVTGPVSANPTYQCRNHKVAKKPVHHFQVHQFDEELDGRTKSQDSDFHDFTGGRRKYNEDAEPIGAAQKCAHGVYDPNEDQKYCSVCNPTLLVASNVRFKKTKIGKIVLFSTKTEQEDQANGLAIFYTNLPYKNRPKWANRSEELFLKQFAQAGQKAVINGEINAQWLRDSNE